MLAPSLGPRCQLIEPWNILDLDLWVSLVPGMARRRSQLPWSDMEQDGKEIYLQTWSKTHSNEQNSTNSNGFLVKTRKIKPLKESTLRLEKCSLVAQHCDCELRDKIQDTFCLKLHEPLDHATQNVPPDNRGEACVINEDLDTRAAQNRSLLSTGQGLSYTHCPPAGTTITNNSINQHLLLQDSLL